MDFARAGRILYVSSVDFSLGNGPGVNEVEFARALRRVVGDRAHFVIPRPEFEIDIPRSACSFARPHRRHHPLHILGHQISLARVADTCLASDRYDLVVFRVDALPFAPSWIARRHDVPYAIKTLGRGTLTALQGRGMGLGKVATPIQRRTVERLVHGAETVDCVSSLMAEYLRAVLHASDEKIVVIDNSVDTRRFSPEPAEEARMALGLDGYAPIVGYVGQTPSERGGSQLVEAAPQLVDRYPNLGILIMGTGPGTGGLVARAESLGVSGHCIFTGQVPFADVPRYVNALDVGVSLLGPRHQTSSELKVRQYLACGKPIVAATPGSNDFLGEHGFGSLVPHDDLDRIVEGVARWLSLDATERASFAARSSRYSASHLSADAAMAQRLALWEAHLT